MIVPVMRALGRAIAVVTVLIAITGCGSSELRTAGQASDFVDDIARGKGASNWDLATGATSEAISVWANRLEIERLGQRLREEGPELCRTASRVNNAEKVFEGLEIYISQEERRSILLSSGVPPAQWGQVNALIDEVLGLPLFDASEAVDAACVF